MNAPALALETALLDTTAAAASTAASGPTSGAPRLGLTLAAFTVVEQTAELLHLACRRGQLEDAGAAARVALPLAEPHSAHEAMLQALAQAQPALMTSPDENRLYMLRGQDGRQLGLLRLRDNGLVGPNPPAMATRWALRDGNLELMDTQGHATVRFALCGERDDLRLYLGESTGEDGPFMLQEVRCTYSRLSMFDTEMMASFCGLYNIDEMVPAELPARAAVLVGTPHSGADRLAQSINLSQGAFIDGPLLHPQGIELAEGQTHGNQAAMLHAVRAKDPTWFARMMMGRSHDAEGRDLSTFPARGFMLTPGHSREATEWTLTETALRVVHVVRSHALAEFADLMAEQATTPDALLHFEAERFERFLGMRQLYLDNLRGRLMQRQGDTVEVDTSRLNAHTVAEVMSFLNDAPTYSQVVTDLPPTRPGRVLERFDNPADVLQCLTRLGKLEWMEAEGPVAG